MTAAVSLQAVTQVSLVFPAYPVLSQLTFEAPGSKSHWFYKITEFSSSSFKTKHYADLSSLDKLPGMRAHISATSVHEAPPFLQAASLHLSKLLNLSGAAFYCIVEFVLPVFTSLSGLLTWT